MKHCKMCGKILETKRQKIFCSRECTCLYNTKNGKCGGWNRKPKIERICKLCKIKFLAHPYKLKVGRGIYCSIKCSHIGTHIKSHSFESFIPDLNKTLYIAGFFDGEGCIHQNSEETIEIGITNTNKDSLDFIKDYFRFGMIQTYFPKNPKWKTRYTWRVRNILLSYKFLQIISPYLIIKKSKAEKILSFFKSKYYLL